MNGDAPYRIAETARPRWFPEESRVAIGPLIDIFAVGGVVAVLLEGLPLLAIVILVLWGPLRWYFHEIEQGASMQERYRRMWLSCLAQQPNGPHDSPAETEFYKACCRAGFKVYAQQIASPVFQSGHPYVADFAYYEPLSGLRVALEVDGNFKFEAQESMDFMDRRDSYFNEADWYVMRFHASDCFERPDYCVSQALRIVAQWSKTHQEILELNCGPAWKSWAAELMTNPNTPILK
jgi:very-short-patch-repair endonuclease